MRHPAEECGGRKRSSWATEFASENNPESRGWVGKARCQLATNQSRSSHAGARCKSERKPVARCHQLRKKWELRRQKPTASSEWREVEPRGI